MSRTYVQVVSKWTGIPVTRMGQDERRRLLDLPERLRQRVVGQDEAVGAVADAVLRSRSGLGNPRPPSGSFLFLGGTGVGKTELAKALAERLFGDEKQLDRPHRHVRVRRPWRRRPTHRRTSRVCTVRTIPFRSL